MSDERLKDLQERFAWLERQAAERDGEILALVERIRKLERQVEKLRAKADETPEGGPALPEFEKPPHF